MAQLLNSVKLPLQVLVCLASVALCQIVLEESASAQAERRTNYSFEAEPHLVLTPLDPPGYGNDDGLGLGFRGAIEVAPEGFIDSGNDSVSIGFGIDWVNYDDSDPFGRCERRRPGPNGTSICVDVEGGAGNAAYIYLPAAMQWNFWVHRKWSVFAEPGLSLYLVDDDLGLTPVVQGGGRFHMNDNMALTLRIGYPTFSLGLSFFL